MLNLPRNRRKQPESRHPKPGAFAPLCFLAAGIALCACARPAGNAAPGEPSRIQGEAPTEIVFGAFLDAVIAAAELPPGMARSIRTAAAEEPGFILDILACLNGEESLRFPVDKTRPLPEGYEPDDLVELRGGAYRTSRAGLTLRRGAAEALEEMAAAARREGITLTVGSAYRSFRYQVEVYDRMVREMGREAADRESARPGHSQHQTGFALDFAPIGDAFAETPAGLWVRENAGSFGWSLSFPDGLEAVTGYRWESWHYRFLGKELTALADAWFGGVQHYALRFLHEWEKAGK